ncbi:MAG: hypothetical protein ABIH23_32415 [bacterium]
MSRRKTIKKSASAARAKRTRVSSEDLPRRTLEDSLTVAKVLRETYAGKAATWEEIAEALNLKADVPANRYPLWSAAAYTLVKKDGNQYALAEVGRKLLAPNYEGEDREGRLKAILSPRVLSKFYSDYNGSPLPADEMFLNVLENRYHVPRARAKEARDIILANAEYAEILEEGADGEQIIRYSLSGVPPIHEDEKQPSPQDSDHDAAPTPLPSGNVCFVITPIGTEDSQERKHANAVLKHLITPVMQEAGLTVVRADMIAKPGIITKQVIEHLAYARLCVADLSFNNPNAFYEMGVRHSFKLPMIQIIRKGDKIPFDVSQGRTIIIDCADPYTIMDTFVSARKELQEHVENVIQGKVKSNEEPMDVYLPGLVVEIPTAPAT